MKKYYILFFIVSISFNNIFAQLSDLHYLPPLKQGNGTGAINQQSIYLSTPETTPFDINIYKGKNPNPIATISGLSNSNSQTYNLADGNNGLTLVDNNKTGTVLNNAGLRFESTGGQEFYVNYRGRSNSQAASLTSKGRAALGTSFKWGGRPNYGNGHNTLNAVLGIMATEDGTIVNIFGYGTDCEFRDKNNSAGITDDNLTIALDTGESYVLEAPRNNTIANIDCWLGASIQSNKDIVISNGNMNGAPLQTANSRDSGIDQPVPENRLGREYVFVRAAGGNTNETPIIIGTQNGTDIFVNGSVTPIATINNGDYFVIPATNYSSSATGANMYVTTSKEAYAYQNIAGSTGDQTGGLNFIAPVNCLLPIFMDNIHDIKDIAGLEFLGEITITASTATPDNDIVVTDDNGIVTLPASIPVTGTTEWKTITTSELTGDVRIQSTGPIAIGFFGVSGNAGVAGYFSGFDSVPTVQLDSSGTGCLPGADVFEVTGNFSSYQWFQNGILIPGETTNSYTPSQPGDFFVRVSRGSCTYDSAVLSVFNCDPEIVLTKTVDKTPVIEGDTVIFTITVEHLGINPATNLIINDVLPPELTFGTVTPSFGTWTAPNWIIGDMYSGEAHTLTIEATVNEVTVGSTVTNTINNTQDQIDTNTITDDLTEDVVIINNELEITKTDRAPLDGSYDTVGEIIIYDFVVTNTGDQIIPSVTITDSKIDTGSLSPAFVSNLGVGDSVNFTATYTITQEDLETDQVINSAIAEGTLLNGFIISDISDDPNDPTTNTHDPTITPLDQKGAILLEKIAQPAPDGLYDTLGEVITYEFTVYNTGNVSLNNVTIIDPNTDSGSISPISIANLQAGGSAVFTAQHTLIPDDFTIGTVTNTATVSGTEVVEGDLVSDTSDDPTTLVPDDPTTVSIPQFGQLEVTKVDSPPIDGSFDTLGETITYTIIVTSVGNVSVTDINIVDPNADTIVLNSTNGTDDGLDEIVNSMAPGETATFIATHNITQEDLDNNQVSNIATVGSLDPGGGSVTDLSDDPDDPTTNTDDPTVTPLYAGPSLTISKSADDTSNVTLGQTITYTYIVTNNGNITFDNVSINDVHSGNGSLSILSLQNTTGINNDLDNEVDELGPGQTATWTSEYVITTIDLLNQIDITNTVTATGIPRSGSIIDPTASETVTINPIETICGGETLSHDLTNDVDPSIVTFSWSAENNLFVTGETTTTSTNSIISDTIINGVTTNQDVVYTITGYDINGIIKDIYTYTVTVQPTPIVIGAPFSKSICTGESINQKLIKHIDNFNDGVDFSWVAADNPNITGETTSITASGIINETLINTSTTSQDVVYTITPVISLSGCSGNIYTYTVTVNPEPYIASNPTDTICSGETLNHTLDSDVNISGTTFSWTTNDNPNVTGETASGTTNLITDTLINISGSQQNIVYTITPTSTDGCIGSSYSYTVTVDPEPYVTSNPTDTICSEETLNHTLDSDVNTPGTTFSWTASDNPNLTGESLTGTTNLITDTLINISGSQQTIVYSITPTSPDGCIGSSYTYTVTVNPEPYIASNPTDTICSGEALNHTLDSDVNTSGTTFSWTTSDNPNVTGESASGTTNLITDTLVNISGNQQSITYTITPTSADGCIGSSYTYTVTVDPEPYIASNPADTICSAETLNHTLDSDVNTPGTTFSWTTNDNPNLTGESTSGTTNLITDTLVNISGNQQSVTYTITPTSADGCTGSSYTYTVTVDPEPYIAYDPTDTICSGEALNHTLDSDVNTPGTTFSWTASDNPNLTGESTSGITSIITDTLVNISGSQQTIVYTITPTSADGCIGSSYTYTVTVNPEPYIASNPTDTICSGEALSHTLESDVNTPGTTFSWTTSDNPNVTGESLTGTTNLITDTLINISGNQQTIVYTITPTSPDGCIGNSYAYTITVNPEPYVASNPTDTICSGETTNHNMILDVNLSNVSFIWVAFNNPDVTGETLITTNLTSINDTLINISGTPQEVVYSILPISEDDCIGRSFVYSYTVTVDPEPYTASNPADTICSGETLNHTLDSDVNTPGTTFSWTASDNPNVTGETTSGTTNLITDTLVNISGSQQTIVYTIIPTNPDGCIGSSYSYTVTVNPEPDVASNPTDTICSGVTLNHTLENDVNIPGTTFSWTTSDNPNLTGETASDTTNLITDTLVNISGNQQTIVYTITPTSPDGCIGSSYTYTVTVDPEPYTASNPADTICSGETLNHTLDSDVNTPGTTFSWTTNDNPNLTGESTSGTTNLITDTLINISGSQQTIVYNITPTSADGCIGSSYTYTVTVNPEPDVASNPADTICSGETLNHTLDSDVNTPGTTFSWTTSDNPNLTGESLSGTTNLITDTLVNISGNQQTIVYTIIPTNPDGCIGSSYSYTVTVNPEPYTAPNPTDTICSGVTLNHTLENDVNIPGTTFSWTTSDNPNVTGESASGTTNLITDTLVNISGNQQTIVYTITPTSPDGCIGSSYTYTVTVDPEPYTASNPADTICSGETLNHTLDSDVNTSGTTFSWTTSDNSNLTGETASDTTNLITDTLVNISGNQQTIVYTITPTSPDGCIGSSYTYTVTVDPEPYTASNPTDTICSGETLNHTLDSDVNTPGTTFSWTTSDNPNLTGETASDTTNLITDTLVNISGSQQTIVYTITPTSPDGCTGSSYTYTVTVDPEPYVTSSPTDTICSAETLNHNLDNDVNTPGTTFSWTTGDNPNVTGETASGTANIITDTLVNISGNQQTIVYTITPTSANGCIGSPYTYTVTVNPEPYVTSSPIDTICSTETLNHTLENDVNIPGTTFSWTTSDNSNLTGESLIGTTSIITDTLINISGNQQTIVYTITPTSADGCTGSSYTYTVTVDPEPYIASNPTDTICSAETLNHTLENDVNIPGTTFSWTTSDNPNVTGESLTGTTSIITDTLINISGSQQTIVYTITPTSPDGCIGSSYSYTVTIDPEPYIVSNPTDTICSQETLNHNLDDDVNTPGTTFSWTTSDNPNVTGESLTGTTNLITDTLVNISGNQQSVTYTITPTSTDGCTGSSYTYTVTVNPEPFVASNPTDTICSGETLNHTLDNDVNTPGTTFSWTTSDNPNLTGETASGTTNLITDTLANISGNQQTIVYTIIPTNPDGCIGSSYTYTVTVNPEPDVASNPTDTICSGVTLNHNLDNDVNTPGTTFSWTTSDNPNLTGESLTGTTSIITDTLVNISGNQQTIVYTITPTSADGCIGSSYTYTVTVDPEPYIVSNPTDTICSGETLNHTLDNDVNTPGTTFSWTTSDNPNLTGESLTGTTNLITDTLINISGNQQTIVYTITPTSPDGCIGSSYTYTVTVNPEPYIASNPTDTICSGETLSHTLDNDVNTAGTTFSWTTSDNPNVNGETASGTTNLITDTLVNISGNQQTIVYTIIPTNPDGCIGSSYSYTVTVNPEPDVASNPTDTICSGVTLNHNLDNDVNTPRTTFSWTTSDNPNLTGESLTGTTNLITDTLINISGSQQIITYTITPTSPDGCIGSSYSYTVTVNPEPYTASNPTDTICSGETLNHTLNSDVNTPGTTFSWTTSDNSNLTGESLTGTTSIITDTLINISGNQQTIVYTITPTSPDGCIGSSYSYTVTIDPEPYIASNPTDTICSGETLNHNLDNDINTPGTTFSWTTSDNPNLTGESLTGTTSIITDTLINISGNQQTIVYTITPTSPDGCIGSSYSYTVTVDPEPYTASNPADTICSQETLNHNLDDDVNTPGTTFSWTTNDNPNLTGESLTGTTNLITDTLINISGSQQIITYTITPTSPDGCIGSPYTYTVTVDPEPYTASNPADTICSGETLNHILDNDVNTPGTTFSWTTSDNPNLTGESLTGTTSIITDTLINISGSQQTIVYTITPTSPDGCIGSSYSYTVTVNPEPYVASNPADTICSGETLNHTLDSDVNTSGTTFSWTTSDNSNLTGESLTGTTNLITDTLVNISGNQQTIVYTITPTSPDRCIGSSYTYTVTVNPEPYTASNPTDTICSGEALNHTLDSDVNTPGTTFSWTTSDNPNLTGESASGATNLITDTLVNISGSQQNIVYTITPTSADGCIGSSYYYTVTIDPEPYTASNPTDTICSGETLNHTLDNDINTPGTTFSWTTSDNPNLTGESLTGTTNLITDTLINISGSQQIITYTITPTSADGCIGSSYSYTVTVDPEPYTASNPADTICSGETLNHTLDSDVNTSGTTFSWTTSDNPNVTGETTSGTTNLITDTLINISGNQQTIVYTITPTSTDGCIGSSYTYTVTVDPEPYIASNPTDTICSGETLNHTLDNDINTPGTTFSWTTNDNPNVTGETGSGTTNLITDTLINISGNQQTIVYTITPTSPDGCIGSSYTYTVTVNPEPYIASNPTDTICSGETLNHNLDNDVNISGTTFSWTTSDNPNVTGESLTGTTNLITDTLVNISGSQQSITYTITPTSTDGCIGSPYTYTVTVNPEIGLRVSKSHLPPIDGSYNSIGEKIHYEIIVENTSEVEIYNTSIIDPNADIGSISPEIITTIPPFGSAIFTAAHTITLNDINSGQVINQATAIATNPCGSTISSDSNSTITIIEQTSLIALEKTAIFNDESGDGIPQNGETITYNFTISNIGNTVLSTITISDPLINVTGAPIDLEPGTIDTSTFSGTYVISQTDIDFGSVINSAIVQATTPNGIIINDISDDPSDPTNIDLNNDGNPDDKTVTPLKQNSSINLTKAADIAPDGLWDSVNEIITYTLEVINSGNVTLRNVVITDTNADIGSIIPANIPLLLPGEKAIVTAGHTIKQSDLNTGFVINSASVEAIDTNNNTISDDSDDPNDPTDMDINGDGDPDDPTITLTPQNIYVTISKTVDKIIYHEIGDILTYTITVSNFGSLPLLNVYLTDPNADFISPSSTSSILPGESFIVLAEHIIVKEDITNALVSNIAFVNASVSGSTIMISEDSDDPNDRTNIDIDNDGDFEDPTISYLDNDGDEIPDLIDLDDDNDGITDIEEQNDDPFLDTDGDGTIDSLDLDADGDGLYDYIEAGHIGVDSDGNGTVDGPYGDDGIPDIVQNNTGKSDVNYVPQDTDDDDIHDFQDIDDDDDTLLTEDENPDSNGNMIPEDAFDSDGDGIPDYLEPNNADLSIEDNLEVYNAISPNGDNNNDVFTIRNIQNFPDNELKIYNRWGVLVYETDGYGHNEKFFDGKSEGRVTLGKGEKLPAGTYYYIFSYKNPQGITKNRSGYLYIN